MTAYSLFLISKMKLFSFLMLLPFPRHFYSPRNSLNMTPQNKLCFVPKGESDKTLFLPHSLAFVCSLFSSFFVFLLHVTIFLEVEIRFSLVDILGHLELAGFQGLVS